MSDNTACQDDTRNRLTALVSAVIVGGLFLANLVYTPPAISTAERRPLATFPELTARTVADGEFMDGFEDYAADSFIGREGFRTLHTLTVFGPFRQLDKGGLYLGEAGAGQFKALDPAALGQTAAKIATVAAGLDGLNRYYAVVPDKSIYAGRYYPGFDPAAARTVLAAGWPDLTAVRLDDVLTAADFYRTDLHWDQTRLGPVVTRLAGALGVADPGVGPASTVGDFHGVYPGQLALPMAADTLAYVPVAGLTARYLDAGTLQWRDGPVYDLAAATGQDPYDLFLQGAQPLVVLENENAASDKELFLFRDSFGSSLAPLLAPAYRQVTLIDLRYIDWALVGDYVDFTPGADVLFLYSSQILGNPSVLLVR